MFSILRKNRAANYIAEIESQDLQQCADIHAAGFSKSWGDGTLKEMLGAKGVGGIVSVANGVKLKNGQRRIDGFLIYRVAHKECEIITIATANKARRKGLGKQMIEALVRHCLSERLEEIFLEVDGANETALALYKKTGFKKVGERKAYYTYAPEAEETRRGDALIMKLDLRD